MSYRIQKLLGNHIDQHDEILIISYNPNGLIA